jgi:hypothetical protein
MRFHIISKRNASKTPALGWRQLEPAGANVFGGCF